MDDDLAISRIDQLTADDYQAGFTLLREQMATSDLLMLKAHFESPDYKISATQLAARAGFSNFETANLRYGLLASKFLDFFQIHLEEYVKINVLVLLENINGEWHWVLRPQVVNALSKLMWFDSKPQLDILQEIELLQDSYNNLQETTRQAIIRSRIGQGQFRAELVEYWQGCSVTGCSNIELLRASHIKPWRDSSNSERLDKYNGLLLIPSLDACFDLGLISFSEEGNILLSSELDDSTSQRLWCINREVGAIRPLEPCG
ncbi:MAG: hypothetical protein FD146_2694 [Anaerolineaceae bacterium]|nr:MAG: hypothetical protein FD146_2694 [Anaerolineaceae bacterium]